MESDFKEKKEIEMKLVQNKRFEQDKDDLVIQEQEISSLP